MAMESKWAYSVCVDIPAFVCIDLEGIKYSLSKSKTLSPSLCNRWEDPTSYFYQTPQRNSAGICSGFKKITPSISSFPLMTKPHPNALLQWGTAEAPYSPADQPICLQESRLDHKCIFNALVKSIYSKLSHFPGGKFQLNKHIIIISFNYSSLLTWS